MRKLPKTSAILWTDNVCYALTVIAPVVFVLALMIKLTGTVPGGRGKPDKPIDPEHASIVLASATAFVLFLCGIVALRVARIRSLFDSGEEVEAEVRKVKRLRGGTTLKLRFKRKGTTYDVSSTFQRCRTTPVFDEGMRIALLVDPGNPKRAVPVALYANDGSPPPTSAAEPASPTERQARPRKAKAFGLQLSSGTSQPGRQGDER